jgi:ATP-dependent helicase/nuclease subunit B
VKAEASKLYSIRAGVPFLDALVAELWHRVGEDPLALSRATILLPTNRAVRAAAEAFLRLGEGRPMLLPSLRPLARVEDEALDIALGDEPVVSGALDLPPAISGTRRQILLARLILQYGRELVRDGVDVPETPDQALRLATALATLIDEAQTQDLDFAGLQNLVADRYAGHWQETLRFLLIVTRYWPDVLEEMGVEDPKRREFALMRAQAHAWTVSPPQDPVIVAGSTGSVPATAELMQVVARLPQGAVILPGLDTDSDPETWTAIEADPSHPQNGMARLLQQFGVARSDVAEWGPARPTPALQPRLRMLQEAMRPAPTTEAWRTLAERMPELGAGTFGGVMRIEAATPREEATAIALALREVAEAPGRTGALITADRTLARRVQAELRRWGLEVDDSGGRPLSESPRAAYLSLLAEAAVDAGAPVPLLSLLKHPLAACGSALGTFRSRVRVFERRVLRGPRPAPGFDGLRAALDASVDPAKAKDWELEEVAALKAWLDALEARLGPLFAAMAEREADPVALLEVHVLAAEALAETDEEAGDTRLWRGDAGEMLAGLFAELRDALPTLGPVPGRLWPGLFSAVMEGRTVRPRSRAHPRLQILGALEARLQHFDRVILGGMVEGSWPREPAPDPWMSRPMRAAFGLPEPERRVGLSAHDFVMAMTAEEVILTRPLRAEGAPTVPSRWLRRLETVAKAIQDEAGLAVDSRWTGWAGMLDRVEGEPETIAPPAPKPGLDARPRRLPVTDIQKWLEDPYAIYAKRILKLRALSPIDEEPGARDRGSAIHDALDALVTAYPSGPLPADAKVQLVELGRAAFAKLIANPTVAAFWWPRFLRVADWFLETEEARRDTITHTWTEREGKITVSGPAGPFELFGFADRIDRKADGSYAIIDYKTGSQPTRKALESGRAPQLPLEALMLGRGGFSDVVAGAVSELAYWRLTGGEEPGRIDAVTEGLEDLIAEAEQGLLALIEAFDDPETPYHAIPDPARAPRFSDYEHLARVREWGGEGGEDG